MDYTMVQKADKELIFYGIYETSLELQDGTDLLCNVRRKYFESGKKQKDRCSYNISGEMYRCSFSIEDGRPLKWKKLVGAQLADRVANVNNGYFIESFDKDRRPFKRVYFNNHHDLLSVEFFSSSDRRIPFCTVTPSSDGSSAVLVKKQNGVTTVLYPFEYVFDKELTEKLNIVAGEPQIFCRTSSGSFYFCTEGESRQRKKALDHILQNDIDDIDTPLDNEENSEPSFEVNTNALEPDKPVAEPEQTEPAQTAPVHINTSDKPSKPKLLKKPQEGAQLITDIEAVSAAEHNHSDNEFDLAGDSSEFAADRSGCEFLQDCPYENTEKLIIESGGRQYFYFGDTDDDKRNGSGRTAMADGKTAYEGSYKDDKRDGFGVYYYKSGKLCYAGSWKQNKRCGAGVSFSPNDGSMYIGKWEDNNASGLGASFDREGRLVFLGKNNDGKRSGAGITYSYERDTFFVGKYKDGEFLGTGTQFDSEGNMLYAGGYLNNMRSGKGISYKTDGTVIYNGSWKNNLYNGNGILYLEDGCILRGSFKDGKANGNCTLSDSLGKLIYTGGFADDMYNGTGRLYSEDGGFAEGRFVDGEPTGVFNEYNRDKKLVYCGEWTDMHRNGKGIEYKDGVKIYDGAFRNSIYEGFGKLYENGELIYAGNFENGIRCGLGTEYCGEEIVYYGQWKNNSYNGCGILYDNGIPRYTGCFADGKRQGRINEIYNRKIHSEAVYSDDICIYICNYTDEGTISYYGNIRDGKRSGMGCAYNSDCEKEFEGIFRDDIPEKPMQVFFNKCDSLPECEQLSETDYEKFRNAPEYAIDIDFNGGKYTGQLKNGIPNGKGSVLYKDHRFTGRFTKGFACGKGIIYKCDGSEIHGEFSMDLDTEARKIEFEQAVYYISEISA